ncbi:TMEM175 family protein [Dictyobacter halimunensis]|uniref:TMEM175 family protein n=1 Tax=Dictyobacter halimunensis TaxID=3026934 RepID=UPI0030C6ACB8
MKIVYSRFAGQSLDRFASLSDGIFAVAMILLALDLRTPVADAAIEVCSAIERRIVFYQILYAVVVLQPGSLFSTRKIP